MAHATQLYRLARRQCFIILDPEFQHTNVPEKTFDIIIFEESSSSYYFGLQMKFYQEALTSLVEVIFPNIPVGPVNIYTASAVQAERSQILLQVF